MVQIAAIPNSFFMDTLLCFRIKSQRAFRNGTVAQCVTRTRLLFQLVVQGAVQCDELIHKVVLHLARHSSTVTACLRPVCPKIHARAEAAHQEIPLSSIWIVVEYGWLLCTPRRNHTALPGAV